MRRCRRAGAGWAWGISVLSIVLLHGVKKKKRGHTVVKEKRKYMLQYPCHCTAVYRHLPRCVEEEILHGVHRQLHRNEHPKTKEAHPKKASLCKILSRHAMSRGTWPTSGSACRTASLNIRSVHVDSIVTRNRRTILNSVDDSKPYFVQ
jgi:hypothetical protein